MRSRLILLITIPTLTAVVLGGSYIVTSAQNVLAYQRIEQLSNLSYAVTGLASHLEHERDWTLQYVGQGTSAGRGAWLAGNSRRRVGEPRTGTAGPGRDGAVDQARER